MGLGRYLCRCIGLFLDSRANLLGFEDRYDSRRRKGRYKNRDRHKLEVKRQLLIFSILVVLSIQSAYALVSTTTTDSLYPGSGCTGTEFDCGSQNDGIMAPGGTFKVNLTDDTLSTYVCATIISGSDANTSTCIIRSGFNNTICDDIIQSTAPGYNKSHWYTCGSANLSACGWNGNGGIPDFGDSTPTAFQINTAIENTSQFIFISYVCNNTPKVSSSSPSTFFRTTNTKGVVCYTDDYRSAVFDAYGIAYLSSPQSCSAGSFCDVTSQRNYTISAQITDSFCSPGCDDEVKNGEETDIDYGGPVCGNCSSDGLPRDEFYGFAKEVQESERGTLAPSRPFDSATYCPVGRDVATVSYSYFLSILFISSIVFLGICLLILVGLAIPTVIVARFLKNRRRGKNNGSRDTTRY